MGSIPTYYLEAYGCSANQADSMIVEGLLREAGYTSALSPREADLNIIFTCTVKTPTANRMEYRIRELSRLGKPLVVAGCMPKTERFRVERICPSASLLGPGALTEVLKTVEAALEGKRTVVLDGSGAPKLCLPKVRRNPVIDIVKIAEGCLGACSFCQVKFARGRLRSYPPELVLKEVKRAIKEGCKEIWLTSQDNGCYGVDIGVGLPKLLKTVCKVPGEFMVRCGMMNPTFLPRMLDELVEAYKSEKLFKFIHIPVQSGSERVLKRMRRSHETWEFEETIKRFRREFDKVTVVTEVIVGFPGETDEDFEETVRLIGRIKPDVVNLSRFSPRPGTEASYMPQLPVEIIAERSKRLYTLTLQLSLEKNLEWIGWEGEVLVDEEGEKGPLGRNFAYKPVALRQSAPLGCFIKAKVVEAKPAALIANVV